MSENAVIAQRRDQQRQLLSRARRVAYKETVGSQELAIHVFSPAGAQPGESAFPALVFFHGGGFWERGEVTQFAPQALHFISRGMVAMLVDYRLGGAPMDSLEDARDAIDWIAAHAGELGIDQTKLVLVGASSGAQAAMATVMDRDRRLRAGPVAGIWFSPLVNLLRAEVLPLFPDKRVAKLASPLHLVRKGLVPMLLFHGDADRMQAVAEVELFARRMRRKKNTCELHTYPGKRSSFFNFNVDEALYEATLTTADDFLVRLGLIPTGVKDSGTSPGCGA